MLDNDYHLFFVNTPCPDLKSFSGEKFDIINLIVFSQKNCNNFISYSLAYLSKCC